MAGIAAVITAIGFWVDLSRFRNRLSTVIEQTERVTVMGCWHMTATSRVNFVITIILGVFVDVIAMRHESIS